MPPRARATGATRDPNRYERLIERLFFDNYDAATNSSRFTRAEMKTLANELSIALPENLGDVVYAFRYRTPLPDSVRALEPAGLEWAIFPAVPARPKETAYRFAAVPFSTVSPTQGLTVTKIPDATPGMIDMYSLTDEQALLAKLRYNRLLDIYSGITTYQLQSHLRTTIPEAQVETDEVYVGVDSVGAHYVFPVQAKGGTDNLSIVQIWQDFKLCQKKFPNLIPKPVAAQFMANDVIALFSFAWDGGDGITRDGERHYKLVPHGDLTPADLAQYAAAVPPQP